MHTRRPLLILAVTAKTRLVKEAGADHQTTLDKLHDGLSDKRDRADELYESETSGPVSCRTRKRIQEKKREASRLSNQNDDDQPGQMATFKNMSQMTICRYLGVRPFN